jgi:hypothetical protein
LGTPIRNGEVKVKNQNARLCILLIIIAGFGLAGAQNAGKKMARIAPKSEQEIIHDIQELEQSLRTAFIDGKTAWWEQHLEEHYAGLNPDGRSANKTETIDLYRSPDVQYEEMNVSDMSARIFNGDCVIASGKSTVKGSYKGHDFSGEYFFVHVWIKELTFWRLANSQATKLPE